MSSDWKQRLLAGLVLLLPILAATVKDGAGVVHALLLLLGLIYGWPAWKALEAREKRLFAGFAIFCLVAALSLLYTDELRNGISKLERYLYFPLMLPAYLLLRRSGMAMGKALLLGVWLAAFVYALQAWYQVSVAGQSLASGAYHKIIFGDLAIWLVAVLVVALLTVANRPIHYLLGGLAISAAAYASLLSMTRGAWLLVPVLAVVLPILFRRSINRTGWIRLGAVGAVVVLLFSVWQPPRLVSGIQTGIADLERTLEDPTAGSSWGERLLMWRDAIIIWKTSPLLGTGIGDFKAHREQLKAQGVTDYPEAHAHAHNIYFDGLATTGLLGLAALLMFVFAYPFMLFYRQWRLASSDWARFYALSGLITVIAFMVFGLTEGWMIRNAMIKTYLITLVVMLSSSVIEQNDRGPRLDKR